MKKIISILFCIAIFILVLNTVLSAPALEGIAINSEKKECAGYWAGDEFVSYDLPFGWKPYYPDYERGSIIETEFGTCNFERFHPEECCKSLGLTFVSQNIGKYRITKLGLQRIILNQLDLIS